MVLVCTLSGLKEENTGVGMRWYLSNSDIITARDEIFPQIIAGGDYSFPVLQKGAIIQGRRLFQKVTSKGGGGRRGYSSAEIIRRSAIIRGNMVAPDFQEGPSTCHSYMAADALDKYLN